MAEGVEHFLKMFIIICISSLENSLFSSLAIFFDWVVCFSDIFLRRLPPSSLIYFWHSYLFLLWTQKHRSHSAGLLSSPCSSLVMTIPLRAPQPAWSSTHCAAVWGGRFFSSASGVMLLFLGAGGFWQSSGRLLQLRVGSGHGQECYLLNLFIFHLKSKESCGRSFYIWMLAGDNFYV